MRLSIISDQTVNLRCMNMTENGLLMKWLNVFLENCETYQEQLSRYLEIFYYTTAGVLYNQCVRPSVRPLAVSTNAHNP